MIKRQFRFVKVRYRGLKKNMAQIITLFALSNLWVIRSKLMGRRRECVRKRGKSPKQRKEPPEVFEKRRDFRQLGKV